MRVGLRLLLIGLVGAWLAGCNTSEGIGKDIKAGGAAIKNTAKETKEKL